MPEGLGGLVLVAVVGIAEVLGTWWKCCGGRSGRYVDRCRESLRVGCVGGAGVVWLS